ncbi:MAG: TRAP-type C4-dicarboxylate transport system, small permease component [uncultured Acetobacteraceae bacterium]|uniref:TRAP transporter small permease protein n=1 Tax=uncultured Acetobacteraceae bacterium TaxID=169975 RepID=A0A6J4J6S7_9PROT|nr:MAG: TRAP-type C4-dicarboxylate transport system, small permease component [uncultured Acetobacteraceae bacterium]
MQRLLLGIDRLSTVVGQTFAWCILVLTGVVVYEVFVRYVFRAPTTWGYDVSYMLYGTLFMMAGAYALSRNGHVRGDFLYRNFPPRRQAWFDLVLYVLFFFPAIFAFMISGWTFFADSLRQNERSMFSPTGPVIWPFKFLIPVVGALLLLQGLVEVVRCWQCIREGTWPRRLSDVEELEQQILAAAAERDPEELAREMKRSGAIPGERAGDQQDGR